MTGEEAKSNDPAHPFTALLKRKLGLLRPEAEASGPKKAKANNTEVTDSELTEEDRELIEGLKRFRGSKLGQEVRDICVSQ